MSVGIVLVSHSQRLAEGLRELAQQMASEVTIIAAGGLEDGSIGTSYDRVEQAAESLLAQGLEVLLLSDLGSATMTVEMVVDFHEGEALRFVDAPFVEGAIAAAVAAQQGDDLDQVAKAALDALKSFDVQEAAEPNAGYTKKAVVKDAAGLHARPAAQIAELAGEAEVFINGVEASSALMVMSLGITAGQEVEVSGDQAVVDRIVQAIEQGLD
ncbi:dihydroxyacetone kinase phosphoryl donor subunit DhaM [Corynebacterium pseudopelargi]|uniref:Phosphocarrier protein HPr n=1 Tax=Corynebacterium pseudopelargi TaxID=2080757 RepID=A0A3G6IXD4_9CORY|nr:dihydroxyacetone kinase phosphoryl donor subunit DhaM [Corynebacterium pseudopelargi]AZA10306.1 PTS-dependent dihydroxyacetone kinase, phosphotransferase subunit DhaM [Corynebacterium pseudopelargi]